MYGYVGHLGLVVVEADVDRVGVEDLVDLVAHQLVHRLHVELGGEALLDAVDDRQLGGALVGLGEQPLRLVEQPGVLERDTEAAGKSGEQPNVGRAECVRPVDVLQRDVAERSCRW